MRCTLRGNLNQPVQNRAERHRGDSLRLLHDHRALYRINRLPYAPMPGEKDRRDFRHIFGKR